MSELTQKFLESLLHTQFQPPERTLQYQRRLLDRLVRHARTTVPYYRDTGRLDVLFGPGGRINWERWDEVPILTRSEAQANSDALYAESMPADCGEMREGLTSGSTGKPLAFRVNTIMAAAVTAALERGFVWAGVPDKLTLAWFLSTKPGEGQYPLGTLYTTAIRGNERQIHQLDVRTTLDQQCEWLAGIRPDVVMGYPGALSLIARNLPRELADHRFLLVVCMGEVLEQDARGKIETGFRCPSMDVYSGSEFGLVAIEDRGARRLLVSEETTMVEFKEQSNPDLVYGKLVDLIVTPFYNYAMPLIRYSTGDLAEIDDTPASDERTLRRLLRIAGRARDFFIMPSGRYWWPQISKVKLLSELLSFDQIQYAQTQPGRIELRFASRAPQPIKNTDKLLATLRAAVPEPVDFVIRQMPEIVRHSSGKYIDYVREFGREN